MSGIYTDYNEAEMTDDLGQDNDQPIGAAVSDDEEALVREIRANIKKSKDHLNDWFEAARENYDYFAGHQWDQEDIQKLREERRPAITFNRIPRTINAICGLELENRQEVIYTPRETGDAIASDILTGACHWVRDQCDAEDEESQAFKDALLCGVGWVETRLDYEVDPDGAILMERVDPLEMYYDPSARKRNLSDAAWIAREKSYSKKEFKSLWPDVDVDTLGFSEHNKGLQPHDAMLAPWYKIDQSANDKRPRDKVSVIQYQKWVRKVFYRVVDLENEVVEMDQEDFSKMKPYIDKLGLKYIKQTRKVFKQYFVAGHQILEEGDSPINDFTFKAMTGMLDRNKNTWFGMVSLMKDPQMWANKWLSQTLHIFNSNAKGGYLAEAGAFQDPRQAERTLATSNVTYTAEGALAENRITPKQAPAFPSGLSDLLAYAVSATSELVGVNLESLGQVNRSQAGILEVERKRSTVTILADFFDALRRYRKEQGRILADFVISYIGDGRLIRVAGPGLGKYVPLEADNLDFKYDIVVDDTPTSPNQKERIFATLTSILPQLLESGIPIPTEILDYAPLPAALVRSWQKQIEEQQPDPKEEMKEEIRMQLAQLEAEKMAQDIQNKKASEIETKTQSALNLAKFQHEQALANHEASLSEVELGLKLVEKLD